jgi:hypothetical protein
MTDLTLTEVNALQEALDDEYRAWATYNQVIADFGEVRPFASIRDAEARHIDALHRLFAAHELAIPENTWLDRVDRYTSVQEACEAGVAAEIENGAMYERLLSMTRRDELLAVFRNLQQASQQRHLEAFRRCAQGRGGAGGPEGGRRRRRRARD